MEKFKDRISELLIELFTLPKKYYVYSEYIFSIITGLLIAYGGNYTNPIESILIIYISFTCFMMNVLLMFTLNSSFYMIPFVNLVIHAFAIFIGENVEGPIFAIWCTSLNIDFLFTILVCDILKNECKLK